MSVTPPRSSDFLAGSSLGFTKPMPRRGGDPRVDQGDSAEFDVGLHSGESATDLWRKLQPDLSDPDCSSVSCAGLMLGHFRVEEQIGRGGMGAVFRAVDTRLDREVAIKVLAGPQSTDPGSVGRFLNEARSAARLDHDNVARVYFVGEEKGLHFIAFEFIHGANVRQVIEARKSFTPAETVNFGLQIAHALRHIAAAGVVHRDVKPSNIIITPAGRAKLVDLGLARKIDPEASKDLTVDGTTLGTFDYISPEQAKDPKNVDIRSDIYSLGCTLFHMLTGEPPYPRGTMLQKLLDHQHKDVPDPSTRNPSVPPELSAVVRKMMASDPGERYASAEELIGDLSILAHAYGLRPMAAHPTVWEVPRTNPLDLLRKHRAWIATAGLLILGVLLIDLVQSLTANQVPDDGLEVVGSPIASQPPDSPGDVLPPRPPELETGNRGGLEVTSETSRDDQDRALAVTEPVPSPTEDELTILPGIIPTVGPQLYPLPSALERFGPFLSSQSRPSDSPSDLAREAATEEESPTLPPPVSQAPYVVHVSEDDLREFDSLEAACGSAPDGSVIELNFDGPSVTPQRPIRIIGKRVRLRKGPDRQPIVRFAVPPDWPSAEIVRMMTVERGSLEVYDVGFEMTVEAGFITDSWVLLSLHQAEELILRGVSVTIRNSSQRPAAVVELAEPASQFDSRMPEAMDRPPVRLDAEDCVFRGQADLMISENVDPSRIRLANVAAALSGSILHLAGMDAIDVLSDMNNEHKVELELRHLTAMLGRAVVRFEIAPGQSVPRLNVSANNSVLVIDGSPLVNMTGEIDEFDAQQLMEWSGSHTYLETPDPVWQITGPIDEWEYDLAEWNELRRQGGLIRPAKTNLLRRDRSIPYHLMTRSDLSLVVSGEAPNAARGGASDGTDAGVAWNAPRMPDVRQISGSD